MTSDCIEIIRALTPAILGVLGIIITLIYNRANKKLNHHKMEKELFTEFNQRYDRLNDSLALLAETMDIDNLKSTDSKIDNKSLYDVVIDYFNLCAEQYYWKKRKRISSKIWDAWHDGMMYYYETYPVVKQLWDKETENEGWRSYYLEEKNDFFK